MEQESSPIPSNESREPVEVPFRYYLNKEGKHIRQKLLAPIRLTERQKKNTRNFKIKDIPISQVREHIDTSIIEASQKFREDEITLIDNPDQLKTGKYTIKKTILTTRGLFQTNLPNLAWQRFVQPRNPL